MTRAAESKRETRRGRGRRAVRALPAVEGEERPRRGAKRTVMDTIRQLPNYVRLLFGLLTDRRVAAMDKLLVGAAVAYILAPVDLIPDFIPFLGEVDDVFLLVTALQRLIGNAGRSLVLQYWVGNPVCANCPTPSELVTLVKSIPAVDIACAVSVSVGARPP